MYPRSGFDLARAIRELRPAVPIVVTYGYFRQDDTIAAAALSLRSLIMKTATVEELGPALDLELGHTRAIARAHWKDRTEVPEEGVEPPT